MKIIERDKIDTPNTQIHDCSLSSSGTCTSIKKKEGAWVKLVLCAQTSPLSEISAFHIQKCMSKMPTLTYNRANSAITKNAIILNFIHGTSDLHDTEDASAIIQILDCIQGHRMT